MTATNPKQGAPDPSLYRPFESKSELMEAIRDDLTGADLSRIQDVLLKLGATDSCLWPDSQAVAS